MEKSFEKLQERVDPETFAILEKNMMMSLVGFCNEKKELLTFHQVGRFKNMSVLVDETGMVSLSVPIKEKTVHPLMGEGVQKRLACLNLGETCKSSVSAFTFCATPYTLRMDGLLLSGGKDTFDISYTSPVIHDMDHQYLMVFSFSGNQTKLEDCSMKLMEVFPDAREHIVVLSASYSRVKDKILDSHFYNADYGLDDELGLLTELSWLYDEQVQTPEGNIFHAMLTFMESLLFAYQRHGRYAYFDEFPKTLRAVWNGSKEWLSAVMTSLDADFHLEQGDALKLIKARQTYMNQIFKNAEK